MVAMIAEPLQFLFVSVPLHGHIHPMMPAAQLLAEAGHRVAFACYDQYADALRRGAPAASFVSLGADKLAALSSSTMDPYAPTRRKMNAAVSMFTGWEEEMYPLLLGAVRALPQGPPDVVVADIATPAAFAVAETLSLPLAVLGSLPLGVALACMGHAECNAPAHVPFEGVGWCLPERMSPLQRRVINPLLKRVGDSAVGRLSLARRNALRARLGLPALPAGWGFTQPAPGVRRLLVAMATSWAMEVRRELPPGWHLVGAMGCDLSVNFPPLLEEGEVRDFLEGAAAAGEPVVFVSFGTIVRLREAQVAELAGAFALLPRVRFVWSLKEDLQALLPPGGVPSNVLVRSWVAQTAVLGHPAVRAMVSHGGQNSTCEALAAGKPILCIGFGADQPVNAQHIQDRGYGLRGDPRRMRAKQLASALTELLGDPSYAAAAAEAGREMRAQSGPSLTARLLQDYASSTRAEAATAAAAAAVPEPHKQRQHQHQQAVALQAVGA